LNGQKLKFETSKLETI